MGRLCMRLWKAWSPTRTDKSKPGMGKRRQSSGYASLGTLGPENGNCERTEGLEI
jgi:hypothetical protein